MIRIKVKGLTLLETIAPLSENDIRLLGFIANEKSAFEKSYEGLEYTGTKRAQVERLKGLGYLKEI